MNEDRAEIWLHRSLRSHSYDQGQTMDSHQADVYFIPAYLHWREHLFGYCTMGPEKPVAFLQRADEEHVRIASLVIDAIVNKSKPHVLLVPTRDPYLSSSIGLKNLVRALHDEGVTNLYSVGFERNSLWQGVDTDHIIPMPYVVTPDVNSSVQEEVVFRQRNENSVFFVANPRQHAPEWSGCNRSKVKPLVGRPNMDIRLSKKSLTQADYNQ
jgi:hypothetical protein